MPPLSAPPSRFHSSDTGNRRSPQGRVGHSTALIRRRRDVFSISFVIFLFFILFFCFEHWSRWCGGFGPHAYSHGTRVRNIPSPSFARRSLREAQVFWSSGERDDDVSRKGIDSFLLLGHFGSIPPLIPISHHGWRKHPIDFPENCVILGDLSRSWPEAPLTDLIGQAGEMWRWHQPLRLWRGVKEAYVRYCRKPQLLFDNWFSNGHHAATISFTVINSVEWK